MKDDNKAKKPLNELAELRSQNTALIKSIAGRISADLATEEARRYAESIVGTIREPLLVLDANLKIISANRNFYRTFKVTPSETLGTFIYDLGNKQWDIPKLRELLEEVLPEKEAFDEFEVDHNFESIGHKIMLLNARRIYRTDIGAKMILLAIDDITEQKRLENLLTESEERYRRLFETASDGIVLLEKREGKITNANPAVERMLGYTIKESIGNNLKDIGVSLDLDDFQTTMQNLNKSGIINYDDIPAKTKSGQHIDTDIYLVDRTKLVQCNIRDITDRKQAAAVLSIKTMLLEAQSETSLDGILAVDNEGLVILSNRRFGEIWKIPQHTLDTKNDEKMQECVLKQLKYPEEFGRKVAYLYEHRTTKSRDEIEFADGRYLDRYSSPLLSNDGQYLGRIWFFRDITDRKRAEEQLRKRENELQAKNISLEELNVALKVLLEHRGKDKNEMQQNIMATVQQLIEPLIEKLKVCPLGGKEAAYVNALEYALQGIISPFANRLSSNTWNFTSKEILVAGLIKEGKSTKGIADILNLSTRAVDFHRHNIRKKLGLNKKNTNLGSYFMSLS